MIMHIDHKVELMKQSIHCMPLPAGIILGLSIGIAIMAIFLKDWNGMVFAAKYAIIFAILVFGGSSIWMLSDERRHERKSLQWIVGLMMTLAMASFLPDINGLFTLLHYIVVMTTVLFIFILAYRGHKRLHQ